MELTTKYLKSVLSYDEKTGLFRWLVRQSRRAKAGMQAGYSNGSGYIKIRLNNEQHYAHRLAFLWKGCDMPEEVDHINCVRSDNRWLNNRIVHRTLPIFLGAMESDKQKLADGLPDLVGNLDTLARSILRAKPGQLTKRRK